ncbi:MaoC family dehydratase [Rhodococcus wratislaviensis]|uniref:MaoC family dehydratase n=1 Tax=Rhodococcus wratislaviensis TaxID=44752 RepID=UPI0035188200
MLTIDINDLATVAPADLGYSRWIEIDQTRIDAFAEVSEDHQWIHTDPARAAEGPFGQTIAHGYLTLSLISALIDDLFSVTGQSAAVNYGLNRVRFPAPVLVGSRVRAHGAIRRVSPKNSGLEVLVDIAVIAEEQDKPACVAEVLFLIR